MQMFPNRTPQRRGGKISWRSDELYILIKQPKELRLFSPFPSNQKWINKYGRKEEKDEEWPKWEGHGRVMDRQIKGRGLYWVCVIAALTACGLSLCERSEPVRFSKLYCSLMDGLNIPIVAHKHTSAFVTRVFEMHSNARTHTTRAHTHTRSLDFDGQTNF